MKLTLRLFGAPVLLQDGHSVLLGRRKAMALLSYLAVTRSPCHRETLAALLWPESDATAAYSALRNVLWILRQSPLGDAVRADRNTVALCDDDVLDVDVNRFRDLTRECPAQAHGLADVCVRCEPLLQQAVRLWRGPFMSGFVVANSVQYEDWQFAEGEALRRELTETLDRMIDYYAAVEDWTAAARYARQWLHVDALNEVGYRKLMQALFEQGKRSEALQAFDDCMRVLQLELGLSPEVSTLELADRIRTTQASRPPRAKTRSYRLPPEIVPVIGRREVAERLEALLKDESVRVVTLVGLGGEGKTSLALHVGRRVEDQYEHGACFVSLDSVRGDKVVSSAIAQALGITLPRRDVASLSERLQDFLRGRQLLLILDGVERVLSQVSELLPALEAAHGVKVLLTSRISLGATGEVAVTLHGLEYPGPDVPADRAADYAAVRFLRLVAQRQGAAPGDGEPELAGMARMARVLEGSPLGLEMAAGWRSVLTWDELADRVSSNLEFLVHMREDVAPRHRTFAAVFEQSWGMLRPEARAALRRLSVFRSAFAIEAAEYVAESCPSHLALLVNRCLIKRVGSDRYEMHELLRQFASGKLSAVSDETAHVRRRHAEHYLAAVERWFGLLTGPEQYPALSQMGREMDNVRAAFQHAADEGATELLRNASEGLFFYYDMRTQFEEAEKVFTQAASAYARHEGRDRGVEAFLLISAGWSSSHMDPTFAEDRMNEGLSLLEDDAPKDRLHAMANVICAYAGKQADREGHVKRVRASAEFYRACHDAWGEGLALGAWASMEAWRDEALAESLGYQSLRLHREAGDAWGAGLALMFLGRMAEHQGNLELALTRYEESQRLSEPIAEDIIGVITAVVGRARVTGLLGDAERCEQLAEEALRLSRGVGYRLMVGSALMELARARRLRGDSTSARRLLEEAFGLLTHRKWSERQACCAVLLLNLALDDEDIGAAERWLREASMLHPEREDLGELADAVQRLRERQDSDPQNE